jgi:hypothetical protein
MSLLWAGLIVILACAVTISVMLFVRRSAPEGSYFEDGDRAAGVFGVIATGFAVMLGFVIFLAFESYDTSRAGAEDESTVVAQQFQTAQFLPAAARQPLSDALVCYARNVAYGEWPQMRSGNAANLINPWGVAMFKGLQGVEPKAASEQAAYGKWLDQTTERQTARSDRTHGAEGVIPVPLWIVLFLSASVIFLFMLFFADSGERAFVQATMMGGVTVVISSMLLLLWFLDNPYHSGVGGLPPTAMERTLAILDQQAKIIGITFGDTCDARGVAR